MFVMFKNSFVITLVVMTSVFVAACRPVTPEATQSPETTAEQLTSPSASSQKEYQFTAEQDGQTALELLSKNAEVETKEYGDAGAFVTSINGLAGNNEHYWAFYVNDKYAEKGASQTILQKGDTIKFVYEAVTTSN